MTVSTTRCRGLYGVWEKITKEQHSTLEALMLPLGCSAIGMLHAAYEESATGLPAGASGSMRSLAAEKQGSVPWLRLVLRGTKVRIDRYPPYLTRPYGLFILSLVHRRILRWCVIHEKLEHGR